MATWNIDSSHSSAQFSIRHLMITNVRGEFSSVTGTVEYDPASPASAKISASIDVATIDTREEKRDAHLKSADFFDVEKFPKITFESTSIAKHGDHVHVKGNLTMHGVTKEIDLEVDGPTKEEKDPWGNTRIGAAATAKIDRRDWGLVWNGATESGGVLVGHEVKLTLDLSLVRK